jgi:hypothetical protein
MNKLLLASLLAASTLSGVSFAQRSGREVISGPSGCIGGKKCPGGSLGQLTVRMPEGAYVTAIEFDAHDNIGSLRNAVLAISADGQPLIQGIQVPNSFARLSYSLDGRLARSVTIYPTVDDEAVITNLRVYYRYRTQTQVAYGQDACIGGRKCPYGSASSINVDLPYDAVITGVEFDAHDRIGSDYNALLRITANGMRLTNDVDVTNFLSHYAFTINDVRASRLTISPAANDEAQVQNIRVYYYVD